MYSPSKYLSRSAGLIVISSLPLIFAKSVDLEAVTKHHNLLETLSAFPLGFSLCLVFAASQLNAKNNSSVEPKSPTLPELDHKDKEKADTPQTLSPIAD